MQSTNDADDLVGDAERERRVLRDSLVQDVPRRQSEARLEKADDAAGEEKEADDEPDSREQRPAAQDGCRAHETTLDAPPSNE